MSIVGLIVLGVITIVYWVRMVRVLFEKEPAPAPLVVVVEQRIDPYREPAPMPKAVPPEPVIPPADPVDLME